MDAIFNAQVGMAFGIIGVLLVAYILIIGWTRRLEDRTTDAKARPSQVGQGAQSGTLEPSADMQKAAAARESRRKKKQVLIQGKDAEIAASVLRRMLSDHEKP